MTDDRGTINYRDEFFRKGIHMVSLSIPTIYYFITRELALSILIPLMVISLSIDYGRYYSKTLEEFVKKFFGFLMRKHEWDKKKKNLSGATYVLISAVFIIIIFPKIFVVTAFAVLIIGDIAAALIGRRFGKTKFLLKSLQGTLAFFVFSCIVVLIAPKIEGNLTEYLIGVFAVAVGAIAENVSGTWADDNFTIPVTVCVTMWLLYIVFLPNLPLILPRVPN
ncbi:MAG: phosphatidate cytidylyltransferase [Ignavibacteria bacterium]|nr:MAG: phosphatidate cytidylyltransferase [Ignavibacteria bacterium]KAF0155293.1 MAG: phosphatidate cytidylyltransferase [Ignavibacteria bacterium]